MANTLAKAEAAWGVDIPDWIVVLADHCERLGQRATGALVGYSHGAINMVLHNKYSGTIDAVEQAVRGRLMHAHVACPAIGEIPTDVCLANQRAGWAPHNPQRIALYHACRGACPHSRIGGKK